MKFKTHPQIGDTIKLGFKLVKVMTVKNKYSTGTSTFLCLEKDGEKRLLRYDVRMKETAGSFERHLSAFGGSSKGNFKTW